jgi:hypothetical protein
VSKDGHGCHRKHLQKGENPGANIVVAMEIMVTGTIEPGPPDDDKQKGEPTYAGQGHMFGQRVG